VGEAGLVGPGATKSHAASFSTGYRGPVGQRHCGMPAIPPDHQCARGGSILEAPCQQGGFFISGVEPISENRPIGGHIRHPRR
jgi:hypothetical protein